MTDCSFGTMDWCCCLQAGHEGPHESAPLVPPSPKRPMPSEREGYWATDQDGERRWYAHPERTRCGGTGWFNCYCGGDLCVCANGGEIECVGCEDCDGDGDDDYYDPRDDEDDSTARTPTEGKPND